LARDGSSVARVRWSPFDLWCDHRVRAPADYPGCPATVRNAEALVAPRWGLWDLVVMLVGALLVAVATSAAMDAADAPFVLRTFALVFAPWIFLAGWPLLVTRVRGNGPVIDLGLRLTWRDTGIGLMTGIIALIAGGLTALVTMAIVGPFSSEAGSLALDLVARGDRATVLLFAVSLAIFAPFVEELAFRGFAFAALRKRGVPQGITILVTAALFALMHFEPVRLPMLLVVGIVLGVARARTGVVGPSMVAHAVNNLPGAVLVVFGLPG
jgi:uncharacterized protein